MRVRTPVRLLSTLALLVLAGGCSRDLDMLDPAPFPSDAVVFDDGFASGVNFQAFLGSKVDAVQIDPSDTYLGSASLRVTVPTPTDPSGSYAGGAFTTNTPRDLSGYNALTFWAKSATPSTLNVAGIGNDNTGTSLYTAETGNIALTTSWQKVVIPLPLPEKLDREGGLFYFAEGAENNQANVIWFDEIQFEKLDGLGAPQAAVVTKAVSLAVGETTQANGTVTFQVGGQALVMNPYPSYFTWTSSNPAVATVSETGLITLVADGSAEITAKLGAASASGAVTVSSGAGQAGLVFGDDYGDGVGYQAFGGSKVDAVQIDNAESYDGANSLKITIPTPTDPTGTYAGGAFTADTPWDLSGYNALTFWAKAATPATLNVAGIGNDNTGTSLYQAETGGFALTTTWQKFTVPLPLPSKLDSEKGLFFFAEGAENDQANTFWFDEIRFEDVAGLGAPQPAVVTKTVTLGVGGTTQAEGTVTFDVGGSNVVMKSLPSYFTWTSSDAAVASVSATGLITMVAEGTADITATLGAVAATGAVTVQTSSAPTEPTVAAPTPTRDAGQVISLFSDAYTDVTVDTWRTDWSSATYAEVTVDGNAAKKYSALDFNGIETTSATVDATAMTHVHMDVWTADATQFSLKLVDFGADGAFGGGDDAEQQLDFNSGSTPALAQGEWVSLDIPLSAFTGLTTRGHLAQYIIVGQPTGATTVWIDNFYFYTDAAAPTEPTVAAPTPTQDAGKVISLFSDAYTDVTVDTWRTDWSAATYAEVAVDGNATKKYSALDFNGIETTSAPVDASGMTHFRMDVWTADATQFSIKLVDFGADGAFGGGDDVEQQLDFNSGSTPALAQGEWVSLDIPLSDFTGLTTRAHLAQYIIVGQPTGATTVWVDNVYFYDDTPAPTEPTAAAPTPTLDAGNVISLFSDAYTDVTVDTWNTGWSSATYAEVQIAGNATKKYSALDFNGIETTSAPVDATAMTHVHMDVWTADATQFSIKLVDFGADGAFGGGDDVEHQLNFNSGSTPALAQGEWVSLDIPLSDFTGLTTRAHLAQYIIVGQPTGATTVWIDNFYFHN